jgi:hypothetical protein
MGSVRVVGVVMFVFVIVFVIAVVIVIMMMRNVRAAPAQDAQP